MAASSLAGAEEAAEGLFRAGVTRNRLYVEFVEWKSQC